MQFFVAAQISSIFLTVLTYGIVTSYLQFYVVYYTCIYIFKLYFNSEGKYCK